MKEQMYNIQSNIHPCFSNSHILNHARLHLPVSPLCNIRCKFCVRSCNRIEERPAVCQKVLNEEEALQMVDKAIAICPELKVVGIAGPGESLASEAALKVMDKVHERYPEMLLCMSTNGLLLKEYSHTIKKVGIKTISVTVNAVSPDILIQICDTIDYHGQIYNGISAAEILIDQQLKGIRSAHELGIVIKVNTVLIPGINDGHIEEIAKKVRDNGADIINIIPLIPQHLLHFCKRPGCQELKMAREIAEKYLPCFKHCQQCRADAFGIPGGKELRDELYGDVIFEETFSHG